MLITFYSQDNSITKVNTDQRAAPPCLENVGQTIHISHAVKDDAN